MIATILELFFPTNPQAIIKPLLKLTDKLEACIQRNAAKIDQHNDMLDAIQAKIEAHTSNMDSAQRILDNVKKIVQ